jgi:hypothetical protein
MLVGVFVLGMFVYHMLKGDCGCKLVEGLDSQMVVATDDTLAPDSLNTMWGRCVRKDSGLPEGDCGNIRVGPPGNKDAVRRAAMMCAGTWSNYPECMWATANSINERQSEIDAISTCQECIHAGLGWKGKGSSYTGCGTAKGGDGEEGQPNCSGSSFEDCPVRCNRMPNWVDITGMSGRYNEECLPYPELRHVISNIDECPAMSEIPVEESAQEPGK